MWEALPNNADWECFKTPILQEILRIENLHQVEHCAFSEVTRLCQQVGCASNRLLFHTILQKLKSFLSMQVFAWTVFPLSLSGIWWLKYFVPNRTKQKDPRESYGETRQQSSSSQTCITPIPIKHTNVIPTNIGSHSVQYKDFWSQCFVVRLWGQWGGNWDDYQRSKSHNDACFTKPQSCSGLVV